MSAILAIAALACACATGTLIVVPLWGAMTRGIGERILVVCVALGLGTGLQSCAHYTAMRLGFNSTRGSLAGDVILIVVALIGAIIARTRRRNAPASGEVNATSPSPNVAARDTVQTVFGSALATVSLLSGAITLSYTILRTLRMPFGDYDAVSMWNARPRFFVLGGDQWRDAFLFAVHRDYPLLLQLTIARYWRYLEGTPQVVPMTISVVATILVWLTLVCGVRTFRGPAAGWLAGLALVAMPLFPQFSAMQYADMPFAFLVLATLTLMALAAERPQSPGLVILAGATAGCAAWTKNEGLPFLMIALAAVVLLVPAESHANETPRLELHPSLRRRTAGVLRFLLGAAPWLIVIVLLKLSIPVSNDLVSGQSKAESLERLVTPERHEIILSWCRGMFFQPQAFVPWPVNTGMAATSLLLLAVMLAAASRCGKLWRQVTLVLLILAALGTCVLLITRGEPRDGAWAVLIPLACLAVAIIFDRRSLNAASLRVVWGGVLLSLAYYVVYLLTPHNLDWHLFTSLTRLFLHVWPVFVLGAMLLIRPARSSVPPAE